MERGGRSPRGGGGVGRPRGGRGRGRGRAQRGARAGARPPSGGSASRAAGGGGRRRDGRGRRRGLEDFGEERPQVQHSDLHVPVSEMLPRCCLNLQRTGSRAAGLHAPPPPGIRPGLPRGLSWGPRPPRRLGGLRRSLAAEDPLPALSPAQLYTDLPDSLVGCRALRLPAAAALCGEQPPLRLVLPDARGPKVWEPTGATCRSRPAPARAGA